MDGVEIWDEFGAMLERFAEIIGVPVGAMRERVEQPGFIEWITGLCESTAERVLEGASAADVAAASELRQFARGLLLASAWFGVAGDEGRA